jgi:hypothetical protein
MWGFLIGKESESGRTVKGEVEDLSETTGTGLLPSVESIETQDALLRPS